MLARGGGEAPSAAAVREAAVRARLPFQRVAEAVKSGETRRERHCGAKQKRGAAPNIREEER
jgi:hypothetical protein